MFQRVHYDILLLQVCSVEIVWFYSFKPRLSVPDFVSFLQSCETKSGTESLCSRLVIMPTSHDRIFRAHSVKSSLGMRLLVYPHIQAHRLKSFILFFLLITLSTSQQQINSWLVGIITSLEPRLSVPDLSHSFLEKRYKIRCWRAGCPLVQNVPSPDILP